jgi:hypothetical protein
MMPGKAQMALLLIGGTMAVSGAIGAQPQAAAMLPGENAITSPSVQGLLLAQSSPFVSEEGRFTIASPGEFIESVQPVDLGFTEVDMYTYSVEYEGAYWAVHYNDYPQEIMADADPAIVLDAATTAMADELNGILVDQNPITLDGYPGREILVETESIEGSDPIAVKVRLYLVDNRFYQVMVGYPQAATEQMPAIDAYLQSFQLL